jgi:hypothetical protein
MFGGVVEVADLKHHQCLGGDGVHAGHDSDSEASGE